jgi:hypothetical protein
MATASKKSKPTKNRKTRRALAKFIAVTTKFSTQEISDIDYFVELVNQDLPVPASEVGQPTTPTQKPQRFNRNQVIRIAVAKYMEQVFNKARALSDEYKRAKEEAEAEAEVAQAAQPEEVVADGNEVSPELTPAEVQNYGESTRGDSQGDNGSTSGSEDAAPTLLAEAETDAVPAV